MQGELTHFLREVISQPSVVLLQISSSSHCEKGKKSNNLAHILPAASEIIKYNAPCAPILNQKLF